MLLAYVLASLVLVAALAIGEQHDDLFLREAHHGYWGLLLGLASLIPFLAWLRWPGLILLLDDCLQHSVQRWLNRPKFRSPLHRTYALLYARSGILRRLNEWLDQRFGSP